MWRNSGFENLMFMCFLVKNIDWSQHANQLALARPGPNNLLRAVYINTPLVLDLPVQTAYCIANS